MLGAWVGCLLLTGGVIGDAATSPETRNPGAHPGRLVVLPDGRQLNFRCSGQGSPTIIFEGGYAADSNAWYKVQPVLAEHYRACAYDRAGAGFSDPASPPRDGASIARDLDQGLRAAAIRGPYIVVGHSAGGLYARIFADLRPRNVVGMVLVDPSITYQDRRLAERFGPGAGSVQSLIDRDSRCLAAASAGALPSDDAALKVCVARPGADPATNAAHLAQALQPGKWIDQISELQTLWSTTSDQVAAGRASYGAMPLIVLTAGNEYAAAPAEFRPLLDAFWTGAHQEIASRSSRGREQRVDRSSHLMMLDRPDAIVAAVEDVAREAKGARPQ